MKKTNQSTKKEPAKSSSTKASSKKPSTVAKKETSQPPCPEPPGTVEIQATAAIEVRVRNKAIEYYINGKPSPSGEIQIQRNGKLGFVSQDGALVLVIEPALEKFNIQGEVAGRTISVEAKPKGGGGKPGTFETFKYSVAVFTGNAVICNDPSLKVFN
jgi:hypothetical protein